MAGCVHKGAKWTLPIRDQRLVSSVKMPKVVGNAREDIAQITLGVETVQLGRADQAVESGGTLTAGVRAGEEIILPIMEIFP